MKIYTAAVQEYLIAELQQQRLTELDFSRYDPEPQPLLTLSGHKSSLQCIAALSNGHVVSGSQDNTLRVWDVRTGQCVKTLQHTYCIICIAALSNGQVVGGCSDGNLRVWDVGTGQCVKTLADTFNRTDIFMMSSRMATRIIALPNDQIVVSSEDSTLRVWDVITGECLKTLYSHGSRRIAALPNGQVVSTCNDDNLCVWDLSTGQCLKTSLIENPRSPPVEIAALPNGQVVGGFNDGSLRVWDLNTGQCLQILFKHQSPISSLVSLPGGQVVSGSEDGKLRVWDVRTGQCLKSLAKHKYFVTCFAVLPNGQLVSGSKDNTLKCWTLFPRYYYDMIAPVLQAIAPECGLKHLSLQGVSLGLVGYDHLRQLVQNLSSLKTLNLFDTDLTLAQIQTLNHIVHQHRVQHQQRKGHLLQKQAERIHQLEAQLQTTLQTEHGSQIQYQQTQAQAAQDQLLQEQAKRIQQLEVQLQTTLQAAHDAQTHYQQTQAKRLQALESYVQTLQAQHTQQETPLALTYPEVTFTSPVIEQPYHRIEEEAIPDELLCPITKQIMWEPVMADDGYTYEKEVIKTHFQRTLTSPMLPEEPLGSQRLVLNRNVRAAIQRLLERHPGWALYQPEAVFFSSVYELTVQTAIVANDTGALLRAIDQEPRLLTRSLTQGLLLEQVWHKAELLEAVVQRLTPAMWSHLVQAEGGIAIWLAKLAKLAMPSLECHLQRFTVFLQALQTKLSCDYPPQTLIAQGLNQALPVLLLHGLNQLAGINMPLDDQQNTALHYAAASGALSLATPLVQRGANLTLKNQAGQTPKALAQLYGHLEVVTYCQQAKLQPLLSDLLGNLGFLNVHQHQLLREQVEQQQATILRLQTQIQAQNQELQCIRGSHSPSVFAVTPAGD